MLTTSFYGKGVAVAGMKTSCGATLIASQFSDIVKIAGGGGKSRGKGIWRLETENHAAGDKVDIVLEDGEGKDIIEGVKKLELSAAVDADGKAKLMNALAGKTVVTVAEAAPS